jgi:pimeloyl-ACP methyl ester carboxylesterase
MNYRVLLANCTALVAASAAAQPAAPVQPNRIAAGFASAHARVNGSDLHYVRGGQGPAVILLHGCPETWAAYRTIMPRLAERYTVIAVDLPGIGRSAPLQQGYDAASMAAHIHALAVSLQLDRPFVVGHDIGGHVAYAYVRRCVECVRGAMILDVPIPGLGGAEQAGTGMWHVGFMMTPGLPEKLVHGRQEAFLGWFYDLGRLTTAERAYYVKAYGERQLHAGFEMYRALPRSARWNAAQTAPNSVPLVVAAGEQSFCYPLLPTFIEGYREKGMTRVQSARIPDAGHYVLADNPQAVAALIERHADIGTLH